MAQSRAPLPAPAIFQTDPHYRIYDASGKPASMEDVLSALDGVEVVCIGELHNDAIAHLFEAELLRRALLRYDAGEAVRRRRRLALSLEMFERDVQTVLDEYLRGLVIERHFLSSARPWSNYQTDYRPLVEFAREKNLQVIAANAPARYVNRVSRLGPDALKDLSPAAKAWLAPLPFAPASNAYAARFRELMSEPQMTGSTQGQQSPHGNSYLLDAQNLRDATMAYAITQHLQRQRDALVLHTGGNFHSESRLGLPEQLQHYRPKTRSLVINIINDKSYPNFDSARMSRLGDFIVLTDPSLPRSF